MSRQNLSMTSSMHHLDIVKYGFKHRFLQILYCSVPPVIHTKTSYATCFWSLQIQNVLVIIFRLGPQCSGILATSSHMTQPPYAHLALPRRRLVGVRPTASQGVLISCPDKPRLSVGIPWAMWQQHRGAFLVHTLISLRASISNTQSKI